MRKLGQAYPVKRTSFGALEQIAALATATLPNHACASAADMPTPIAQATVACVLSAYCTAADTHLQSEQKCHLPPCRSLLELFPVDASSRRISQHLASWHTCRHQSRHSRPLHSNQSLPTTRTVQSTRNQCVYGGRHSMTYRCILNHSQHSTAQNLQHNHDPHAHKLQLCEQQNPHMDQPKCSMG